MHCTYHEGDQNKTLVIYQILSKYEDLLVFTIMIEKGKYIIVRSINVALCSIAFI